MTNRRIRREEPPADQPVEPIEDLPCGSPVINERFLAFGGDPLERSTTADVVSAILVAAEQINELIAALHALTSSESQR